MPSPASGIFTISMPSNGRIVVWAIQRGIKERIMTDRKKSMLGHGVLVAGLSWQMLFWRLDTMSHLALFAVGILAGLWAGIGPANRRRGAFVLAIADVVLVNAVFWYIYYMIIDFPSQVRGGLMDEGFTLFAIALAPTGVIFAGVSFWMGRLIRMIAQHMLAHSEKREP
ncbi:MAG: hypothetical protein JST22_15320 [Bacteroidetes bacterium]|nr:hypothetical protein [Bacteroidota bacterium]